MIPDYIHSVGTGQGENCDLVHVPYDRRAITGQRIAAFIDETIRLEDARRSYNKKLCPGCTMAVVINALIRLSKDNKWDFAYVRDHMNKALDDLVKTGWTEADTPEPDDVYKDHMVRSVEEYEIRIPPETGKTILSATLSPYGEYLARFWGHWVIGDGEPLTLEEFSRRRASSTARLPHRMKNPQVDFSAPTPQAAVERSHRYDHD